MHKNKCLKCAFTTANFPHAYNFECYKCNWREKSVAAVGVEDMAAKTADGCSHCEVFHWANILKIVGFASSAFWNLN